MNRMPAIFIGHGNPMNALMENHYTQTWSAIGKSIPKPRAVLSISAHWYVPKTAVTASLAPRTIHDFGGFPDELYQVKYPAPGDAQLALQIQKMFSEIAVDADPNYGLDHGTWSVLVHLFPEADVPVVQFSIDETQAASFHFDLGKKLASLRNEGILILGSGNLVHNLHTYAWGRHLPEPYDWAIRFETYARKLMLADDFSALVNYESLGRDAMLSIPTPDHYLPLLYVLATKEPNEKITFPVEGIDGGSVSMLTVQVG